MFFWVGGRDHYPKCDIVFWDHFQKYDFCDLGQRDPQKITILYDIVYGYPLTPLICNNGVGPPTYKKGTFFLMPSMLSMPKNDITRFETLSLKTSAQSDRYCVFSRKKVYWILQWLEYYVLPIRLYSYVANLIIHYKVYHAINDHMWAMKYTV